MTLARLTGLDDHSLWELSRKESLDLQPGLPRDEVIAALLEAWEEDRRECESLQALIIQVERSKFEFLENPEEMPSDSEPALPERYEENYCGLLLRDPDWAFCFWEVKTTDWHEIEKHATAKGLYIRVLENQTPEMNGPLHQSYLIPIQPALGSRYIQLPRQDRFYQVEVLVALNGENRVLSRSQVIYSPGVDAQFLHFKFGQDTKSRELLELSDYHECEPVRAHEIEEAVEEKPNPHRLSDWSQE